MFWRNSKCEPRASERASQFDHLLARSLAAMIFVTVLALGVLLICSWAAMAQPGGGTRPCFAGHLFEPGPIVNGHNRQPTQAEIDERTRELWASRASAGSCR
jgi:hypothetical protein